MNALNAPLAAATQVPGGLAAVVDYPSALRADGVGDWIIASGDPPERTDLRDAQSCWIPGDPSQPVADLLQAVAIHPAQLHVSGYTIAARDVLTLPSLVTPAARAGVRPPRPIGFFNQLKQEFVSARWTLYEGLTSQGVHFSNRDVLMYDTLDYPAYSLATERIRSAFRTAYSLLDKTAFFIDAYWELGKKPSQLSFRTVWYKEGRKALTDRFSAYANWPLRGLFWLSKELFDENLKTSTAADARELHDLRNQLEHRYIQAHSGWAWPALVPDRDAVAEAGEHLSTDELAAKATRVIKLARTALIHLSLAVAREEEIREADRGGGLTGAMPLWPMSEGRKREL